MASPEPMASQPGLRPKGDTSDDVDGKRHRGQTYDVEAIRRDFPALSLQVHGKPLVYLDNAASAQKPKAMLDALMKAYTEEYANVHRGLHYLANAATAAYEAPASVWRSS